MQDAAQSIHDVIKGYRNHDGVNITVENIRGWGRQFGDDEEFVLAELSELLPETYVSRERAKNLLANRIKFYIGYFSYSSVSAFLTDTEFLDLQLPHKSQPAILVLLEEVLNEQFDESYLRYKTFPKINFIYFDDILASGSTIGRQLTEWLNLSDQKGRFNHEKIQAKEIRLSVSLFCCHRWGLSFQQYRLTNSFKDKRSDRITWHWDYEVQNHAKFINQRLNLAKPVKGANLKVNTYFASLIADKYEDYAFRELSTPIKETFFTNAQNRIKFENILVDKGIDIINMIEGEVKSNIRPLGLINPSYKIMGLGTHFFTWRNIPNNSPLVYWWEVPGHDWKPLFSVINRGN